MTTTLEEFSELAKEYTVIPVWKELVADYITPVAAFTRVVGDGDGFLLESVEHGERWSRWSFIGRNPLLTVKKKNGEIEVLGDSPIETPDDGKLLAFINALQNRLTSPVLEELPPMHSGIMGYVGYDLIREIEDLPNTPHDDLAIPESILSVIGELAVFDHWKQRVVLIANAIVPHGSSQRETEAAYAEAVNRLELLATDGARSIQEPLLDPPIVNGELPSVQSTMTKEEYCSAVEVAKEHILAGDIFQVVLSQRFDFDLNADSFDVYRVLRQTNPSPYMYYVRHNEVTLVGCSPEPMVQVLGDRVISRPIAGTRARGKNEEEDRKLAAELREHPKEIAEHVMLVDLARNDLGRVSRFGTLEIDEMMSLENYSHVMHLTSQISGKLTKGKTPIDVIEATFPAGTVSGAPKVRAMQIIDDLEPTKRGPYAGIVGYFDLSGNVDNAIAIRTMVITESIASVQAGAGIVADSDPESEYQECWNKAAALLAAVIPAERMTRKRKESP